MCIVEIHELNITSINKTRTESKQTKTCNCNLGQNLLRHITKIPIFFVLTLTKMLTVTN